MFLVYFIKFRLSVLLWRSSYQNVFFTFDQERATQLIALQKGHHICNKLFLKQSKFHPRTDHEGPDGEQKYSSTLSLTLAQNGLVNITPRPLYLRKRDLVLIV
jgi:hypothetical protein